MLALSSGRLFPSGSVGATSSSRLKWLWPPMNLGNECLLLRRLSQSPGEWSDGSGLEPQLVDGTTAGPGLRDPDGEGPDGSAGAMHVSLHPGGPETRGQVTPLVGSGTFPKEKDATRQKVSEVS